MNDIESWLGRTIVNDDDCETFEELYRLSNVLVILCHNEERFFLREHPDTGDLIAVPTIRPEDGPDTADKLSSLVPFVVLWLSAA